jgi:hypothetical protein
MPASWVSAGAAAIGVANQMGAFGGGSGGGSTSSGTYDPYGQYRGQAASQLNTLMDNPSLAMSQPGYQQTLQQGTNAAQRGAAATGQLQSGAEQAALQNIGQNTFGAYYNQQLANLMQLSGASQSPAAAGFAQQQAATLAQNRNYQNLNQLTSTIGAFGNLFNSPSTGNQSSAQNIAGYASSGPAYQQSFGSDDQFGSYDSGAYQGPV